MIGIIASEKDLAGMNILGELKSRSYSTSLVSQDIIHAQGIDSLGLELAVFASRHKSQIGTPSLTVHSTGNYGKAEYGGEPKTLQNTITNAKHNIYLELRNCALDYEVVLEATHHGPTGFKTPLFFVEIGSTKKQWIDKQAGEFVAECIVKGLDSKKKHEHAIGFGGGHYCPRFSEMEDTAFSHICPKYAADELTPELVKQMIEKTIDGVDYAVIDEKGLKSKHKHIIKQELDSLGMEY